jgi:hypothetical protein
MDIPPDDGLKWFGEGFDGFPKRLPDDTIEYMIHIIDAKLSDAQTRSRLNEVLKASNYLSKKLLKDYIWQREAFLLSLKRENDRWLLSGRTGFGDSIADEWLIVYMLRELSRQFADAWIRIHDTDGEFLLIEAANALPKWLNPEIADNRVWLNRGQLRIIPLEKSGDAASKNITLQQALKTISSAASTLIHSSLIEEEAFYRLQKYPQAVAESMHATTVTVPRKLSYLLHTKPTLTSAAVEAFYLRDPISLRPLNKPTTSELRFPPEDFVTISTRFNKASFAQLKSQEFPLQKAWENVPFPSSSDPADVARRELGMKLACGFEMLVQDLQNKDKKAVREIQVLLEDLDSGDDSLPTDAEIKQWPMQEDSESWMDINFEDFERELSGKRDDGASTAGKHGDGPAGFGDKDAQENLRRMVDRFEKWMNDEDAGAEGAELDDMDVDDEDEDEDEDEDLDDSDQDSEEEDRAVSFDENEFRKMMRQMMGMPDDELEATLRKDESDVEEIDEMDSEDEEIRLLSERMEAELNASGALNLDPTPRKVKAVGEGDKGKGKAKADSAVENEGDEHDGDDDDDQKEDEDGAINIDYNLAKNMLEAFKGQSGMAGPAGNMMGLMGIAMPRDEKDKTEK